MVRTRFGVDEDVCTGGSLLHPPLGLPEPDREGESRTRCAPIRSRTSTTTASGAACAAEVAHAAVLCPSFFRAEVVNNPSVWDRFLHGLRSRVIGALARV